MGDTGSRLGHNFLVHNFATSASTDEDNPADAANITQATRDLRDKKFLADLEIAMQQIGMVACKGADKSRGNDEVILQLLQSVLGGHKPYMSTRLRREMEQVSTQRDSRTTLRIKSGKAFSCQKTREQRDAEESRRAKAERRARHESRLRREARVFFNTSREARVYFSAKLIESQVAAKAVRAQARQSAASVSA